MRSSLVLAAALAASCASMAREITQVWTPQYEGVIFSAEYAKRTFFLGPNDALWTPSENVVAHFEKRLTEYLTVHRHAVAAKLPSRMRQYVGVIDPVSRKRYLEVQFLCDDTPDWNTRPMFFSADGGDCNCAARFDPKSDAILSFGCAGYA